MRAPTRNQTAQIALTMASTANQGERYVRTARSVYLLLVLSLIWGTSFLLIKVSVETVPPFTAAAGRAILSTIILYGWLRMRGERMPPLGRAWLPFLALGLVSNAVPFVLIGWSEQHVDSGLAAILIALMPLFTVFLLQVAGRDERMSALRLAGIAIGLAGVVVLVGPDALKGFGTQVWAQIALVVAAISYAVGIFIATGLGHHSAAVKSVGTLSVGALYLVPLSLIFDSPWTIAPSALSVGAIITLAIVSTGIAAIAYFHLIATAGGAFMSLSGYITPVVAVAAGAILLGEDISARALLALAIILVGVALAGRRGRPQALAPPA